MHTTSTFICQHQGRDVFVFTLRNSQGMTIDLTNYGGIIQAIKVPNKEGNLVDVVLGFDNVSDYWSEEYLQNYPYFGALIGRYANRIAQGQFSIDEKKYQLSTNAGKHQLHGGLEGFDKKVWEVLASSKQEVLLQYESKDGEEGFPGNVRIQLRFSLSDANELTLLMTAQSDQATPLNLTHHGYFNLEGSGHIGSHQLQIAATHILVQDADLVPTGVLKAVEGSAHDFTQPKAIAADWDTTIGYDQTFVLNALHTTEAAAKVYAPQSGICMELFTNQPAIQFYTAKHLAEIKGKNEVQYGPFTAFCLEDQVQPDAVNHPHFPNTILRPGETYRHETRYVFFVRA
ncbi:MAG: aldose epimerase family protein [Sphingobacteriaceae bacterium]